MEILTLVATTIADATPGAPGGIMGYQGGALKRFPQPYPVTTTFTAAIPFTGNLNMGVKVMDADIPFTVNVTGSVPFGQVYICVKADGSHDATFGAGLNIRGAQTFDNTNLRKNFITFWRDIDDMYYYEVNLGPIG